MKVKTQKIICTSLVVILLGAMSVCIIVAFLREVGLENWLCLASFLALLVLPLDFWLERLKKVHERGSN